MFGHVVFFSFFFKSCVRDYIELRAAVLLKWVKDVLQNCKELPAVRSN